MLKAALVGTGLIATQKHLPAWSRMPPLAQVVALCDVDLERGRSVANQFGVPNVYADVGEMLEREHPDIVDICTPPRTHAPLAIQSLRGGAHVLVEKPMAVTTEECDEIMAAAHQAGRNVCVAHSDLFYPSFLKMRQLVQQGAIGQLRGMQIYLSTPVDYITSNPEHWANKLPGGVLGETGPHVVYMTLALIHPIRAVQVQATKLLPEFPWSPFEDYRLILAGDASVSSVTLTYATNQWAARVDVWGSRGIISADLESQAVLHADRTRLTTVNVGLSALRTAEQTVSALIENGTRYALGRFSTTHELLIRAFCQSIEKGAPPPVSGEEGREAIRVMELIVGALGEAAPI